MIPEPTGPAPTKRTGARIRLAAAILLALTAVAVLAGSTYERRGRERAIRDFPPPGRLVDIGGRRIQLDCRGTGSPTVVFEGGLDIDGALAWSLVHDSVAATTRACAYSRAGIMWSDQHSGVRDGGAVAEDLHAALENAKEHSPFVLVGHSLGGPYAMTYVKRYADQVAGVVLVDASHPDQEDRLKAPLAWRLASALAWTGVVRIGFPSEPASHRPAAAARARAAYAPTSIHAMVQELESLDSTLDEAGTFRRLGSRPLVVLTATRPLTDGELAESGMTRAQAAAHAAHWKALQDDEATWSSHSRHELVPDAGHNIQLDQPDAVIRAVRSVVADLRNKP